MKKDDDNLLGLDRVPTMEELQKHFQNNDFSAAAYKDLDYSKMPAEEAAFMKRYLGMFNEQWDSIAKEMGLETMPANSGEDNPLLQLRKSIGELAVSGAFKLMDEQPKKATQIISEFAKDPDVDAHVDDFFHNAIETTMEVMNYPKLIQVMHEIPAHEDFKSERSGFRAQDFYRKWNHSRAETKVVSLDELQDNENEDGENEPIDVVDKNANTEAMAFETIRAKKFWASLNEKDRELLELKMSGMTQKEIADELGYSSQSAIAKRLQKLREKYEQIV